MGKNFETILDRVDEAAKRVVAAFAGIDQNKAAQLAWEMTNASMFEDREDARAVERAASAKPTPGE